jgi:hypothetical protein
MAEIRSHYTTLIIGRKRSGKSTKGRKIAEKFVEAHPAKRVLILDVNAAPAYADLPLLTDNQVKGWKPNAKLRIARYYNSDYKAMVQNIQGLRGGLILFEDCTKYIDANPHPAVKGFLVDHRMRDLDLIFTFHSVSRVPPFMWEMTHQVLLHKTTDDRNKIRSRPIPSLPALIKAWDKLMLSKDDFEAILVDTYI